MYVAIEIIYSGNVEHISNLLFEQYLCEKKKFMNLKIHDIFAHFFFYITEIFLYLYFNINSIFEVHVL